VEVAEPIPREELDLVPLAEQLVQAFEAAHKQHCPQEEVVFIDCGACEYLHVFGKDFGIESRLSMNIPPQMWKRVSRQ